MRMFTCLLMLFAVAPPALAVQKLPIKELRIDGIYVTRAGDATLYCLLGGNSCIGRFPDNAWNRDSLIDEWITAHPRAVAVPLSSRGWRLGSATPSAPRIYLWVEDGGESLNVALVREGHYPANAMMDMVEADQQMLASLPPDTKAQVGKEREKLLEEERPRRLVSDDDYSAKFKLVLAAEMDAKTHHRGIWSEAGFHGRAPPKDSYLIRQFLEKRDTFERVQVLASTYSPLASLKGADATGPIPRLAGVPPEVVQEYRGLLEQLDANQEFGKLSEFDEVCLAVSDIIVGAFDNGFIKGYVFRREVPNPLVDELDHAKADPGVDTIYRRINDNWYLFQAAR